MVDVSESVWGQASSPGTVRHTGQRVHSAVLTCLFNRLALSELRDLGRKVRSAWVRAWGKKMGKSLHLERLLDTERDVTADLEEKTVWSMKREASKKQNCSQTALVESQSC